tara:strand:+ start:43 stop:1833 length:1791 start_codon:yes stop_codon:yes gene_type:complete
MKLNHIEKHPHHGKYKTSDGISLYHYQDDAVDTIVNDYLSKTREDYDVVNILKVPTGGGKSLINEVAIDKILDCEKLSYDGTKHKTIFLVCPLKEILGHLKDMATNSAKSRDDVVLYFDSEDRYAELIENYNKDKSLNAHKIFVFSDKWAESNHHKLPDCCDFICRDEAKGVNVSSEEEAIDYLGEYKWKGKWFGRLKEFGGYILVLNATPSDAQKESSSFNILDIKVERNVWQKPFLNESHGLNAETVREKEQVVKNLCDDFLEKNLFFRNRVKLTGSKKLMKYLKKTMLIKCSTSNALQGLLTTDVKDIIEKYNKELIGKKFTFTDPKTKKEIEIEYKGDLLVPVIKDDDNPQSIRPINSNLADENILIVCELGTYGVNIHNLSHICLLRDTQNQNIGKVFIAEQLFGRMKRNLWIDWIYAIDAMLDSDIDLKDYEWIRDTFIDVAGKSVWYLKTDVNDAAFANFSSEMPSKTETIKNFDSLVKNDFDSLPKDKDMIISTGDSADRNYADVRSAECDLCDNSMFDLHYEKLIKRGYGEVVATSYTIKQIMENAHTHTRDDGTQRSICKSCHQIETMENKHYLASDHPDRKKVDA